MLVVKVLKVFVLIQLNTEKASVAFQMIYNNIQILYINGYLPDIYIIFYIMIYIIYITT